MNQFATLSIDELEQYIRASNDTQNAQPEGKFCPDCNIAVIHTSEGTSCPECKLIINGAPESKDEAPSGTSRLNIGNRSIYASIEYSKQQREAINNQLINLNMNFETTGIKIPQHILDDVANTYNEIQQIYINDKRNAEMEKKFVKRAEIKDSILGFLLYLKCREYGLPRRKNEIVKFMRLISNGLSKGERILRELHTIGKINIPMNIDPKEHYIDRYLEMLKLVHYNADGTIQERSKNYKYFVLSLVKECIRKKVSVNSTGLSKIVGCIWILIIHMDLDIDHKQVEQACDKIRKNTFIKVARNITDNILHFIDIFEKYNVPHRVPYKIIKVRNNFASI